MSDLEMLSDYAWQAIRFIAANHPYEHTATDIAGSRRVATTDRTRVYLVDAEGCGLVRRHRWKQSWLWELTSAGRAALTDRAAQDVVRGRR